MSIDASIKKIVGLDVGGTKTAVVLGDAEGRILSRKQFPTNPARGFEETFDEICTAVRSTIESVDGSVSALSVSIGGPLDVLKGIIKSPPNLPGWDTIPLKKMLVEKFRLPVYIEHDGNAGALAEFYFGAGKGFRNIVFITMGTGFGAGFILDRRLYRGTSDVAGEIGHIRIAETGPLCYGKSGSLEGYASGSGITKLAQLLHPELWSDQVQVVELYEACKAGSAEAKTVFEKASMYLGRGLAIVVDFLNPQRVILGGLGMRLQDVLLEPALRVYADEVLPEARAVCEIVPAALGESIGDYAALCAAYDQGGLLVRADQVFERV
ncbi:MAG: ROK family protein [Ignavibacteriae bacterium]|nr:ROK family protein [Ignavibacteriota bacterium]